MKGTLKAFVLTLIISAGAAAPAHAVRHYRMLSSGYFDGPTIAGTVGWDEIFTNVPLAFETELGYSWSDLGNAEMACRVFINDNQIGRATTSSGGTLHLAFNATYPIPLEMGKLKMFVVGGPRWARWAARHEYINGNEDFDVVGKVWGLGGGLRGVLPLSKKFSAALQLTVDYYPRASIYGHDATYYPDNNNVNARTSPPTANGYTFTYADAASATAVPHIRPRVLVGIMF